MQQEPAPRPPIVVADVDPRAFGCSESPYRALIVAHAPRTPPDGDRVICGHCRIPWEELREHIAWTLLMERRVRAADPQS